MRTKIVGIVVCMMLFSIAVLPVTSNPVSESENIDACNKETKVRVFYFSKIDFSGKGEVVRVGANVNFNLTEGEGNIFAPYSVELDKGGIERRHIFGSYMITSPARGFFSFFKGTVEHNTETEIVEIHGSAIFGVSGP